MTQPTFMDHVLAMRREIAALRQEQQAVAQVVEAVGQAVAKLYETHMNHGQDQPMPKDPWSEMQTYSQEFINQQPSTPDDDDF